MQWLALLALGCLAGAPARADEPAAFATGGGHEVVVAPAGRLWRGPVRAAVTIEVWASFGPRSLAALALAQRAFSHPAHADVREVVHLSAVGAGPSAELAVEMVLEAIDQGRGWAVCDRLVVKACQASGGSLESCGQYSLLLSAPELVRVGIDAGLDGDRLAEALASRRHLRAAERLAREALGSGHRNDELTVNGQAVGSEESALWHAIAAARRKKTIAACAADACLRK